MRQKVTNCCINTDAYIERSISSLTIIPNRYTVNIDKNTIRLYSLNCVHPFTIHIKENNFEYRKNYIEYAINNNLFLDVCISNCLFLLVILLQASFRLLSLSH